MVIPEPSLATVKEACQQFTSDPSTATADAAVRLAFQHFPRNDALPEVLVKVVTLNRLYSTNIYDVYTVAKHICDCNIDEGLTAGDPALVGCIANVKIGQKPRYNYSFATKFCAMHQPDLFQIYDSLADLALWRYQKQDRFSTFRRQDLWRYDRYLAVVSDFQSHYGLAEATRREIDCFLWLTGGRIKSARL